jgi:hypothetical protein
VSRSLRLNCKTRYSVSVPLLLDSMCLLANVDTGPAITRGPHCSLFREHGRLCMLATHFQASGNEPCDGYGLVERVRLVTKQSRPYNYESKLVPRSIIMMRER